MATKNIKKRRGSVGWALGLSWLSTLLLTALAIFLMLLTTQFLMNSSATVLVLPIAIMLCQAAGINPLAGAMSVSVCASGAFVTPFGTAPNLLVWEAGGYSVKDYLKCGFPMLVIFGVSYLIGFLPTLLLFYIFWLRMMEKMSVRTIIIATVVMTAIVYGTFSMWLKVPFPEGLLLEMILG